jgi:hypothetical protein
MFSRLLAVFVAALLALLPTLAFAREGRIQRVAFRDGHAVVKGRIKGYQPLFTLPGMFSSPLASSRFLPSDTLSAVTP